MATKNNTTKKTSNTIKKKDLEKRIKNKVSPKEKVKIKSTTSTINTTIPQKTNRELKESKRTKKDIEMNIEMLNSQRTKKPEPKKRKIKKISIKDVKKCLTKIKICLMKIGKIILLLIKTIKNAIIKLFNNIKNIFLSCQTKIKTKPKKKRPPKEQKRYLIKIKILLMKICKVLLISLKKIKNFIINQYNRIKDIFISLKKKPRKKVKKVKKVKNYNDNIDELNKLHYRDYQGLTKIKVFFINRIRVMKFDMKRFGKKFKYGTIKDKLLILLMIFLILGFSLFIAFAAYIVITAPEISNERLYRSSSSEILDKDGNIIARLGLENREKIKYEDIPQVLIDAIVSAEDSRFFQHNGIDLARFTKAVIGQLLGRSDAGGGSTLTMQISKKTATSSTSTGMQGIIRKFTDIYLSVFVFEKKYTKEEIMEFYVNLMYLGSSAYGVEQASKTYFGKSASELTLVEAATIAGLFQAPTSYDPFYNPEAAQNRRDTILNLMCRHGYITEEERDIAKAVPIESLLIERTGSQNQYQDFLDTVIVEVKKRTGYDPTTTSMTVYTTMDTSKQDVVNKIVSGEDFEFKTEKSQVGIAVIDVDSGALVAVGASRDPNALVLNYATSISRHPGSTAKPIIDYGPAMEYLGWGTGTTVIDDKTTYTGGGQIKNFDNGYKGIMTVKTALAQSRNIPALYTFQQTTNEQKVEFSNKLGWHPEDANGQIVESAAIGGFEGVSPVQSAAAYATFARGGTYIEPYSYTKIVLSDTGEEIKVVPEKYEAVSEETSYMINMMLKYAVTSGSVGAGSVSGTDLCAKTGTSTVDSAAKKAAGITGSIIGDSWEVAYSPDIAIATWYGYDPQISKDYYLTSTEGGNARKAITKYLTKNLVPKNSRFEKPSGVVSVEIELETDPIMLASAYTPKNLRSTEYFKKGTEPTEVSDRFSQLENATNLKYSATDSSITLSWTAAPTPNQKNEEYLKEYFNSGVYQRWADTYYQKRINYNNSTFGSFGYRIYMTNSSGTKELGFTTNTNYTVNTTIDASTSFTVKASYQNFPDNQASGITVQVSANTSTIDNTQSNTTTTKGTLSIQPKMTNSCWTVDSYNSLGNNPSDKVTVTYNDKEVNASVNVYCYQDGEDIDCPKMENGKSYKVKFDVRYNGLHVTREVGISSTCP